MKKFITLLLLLLCVSTFSQQTVTTNNDLQTEYNKFLKMKKTGVAGIVLFGTTWLAGSTICIVEQNRYANDRWDGKDLEEFARLSNEAKKQSAYKLGEVMSIVGCVGTGVSIFLTAKYGSKARRIRDSRGNEVALFSMDIGLQSASLKLTF